MSFYSTPLQFGYFFALLMALIFWRRSLLEERLSDRLMGFIMLVLALELQDYTFGFSGINVLWEELKGFPRGVWLLLGPLVYLYLRSQTENNFKVKGKQYLHFLPYLIYFIIEGSAFIQGPEAVEAFQKNASFYYLDTLHYILRLVSYSVYFYLSIRLLKNYRQWTNKHYSNPEAVSFKWFRNFIYLMIIWIVAREIMSIVDNQYDLPFYQDWWWNLLLAPTAVYVGLEGLKQKQPKGLRFQLEEQLESPDQKEVEASHKDLLQRLEKVMQTEHLYLQAELTLAELAQHLNVSYKILSAGINQGSGMNFNDYINRFRVHAFEEKLKDPAQAQYTLLAHAMDCGFNSKATFNRAFKKLKGISPQQFAMDLKALNS